MDKEYLVIDVRTAGEFERGHIEESINIPLNELESHIDELKQAGKDLILCCASGARSGHACQILAQYGLKNIQNGGSWSILQFQLNDNNLEK
jgi:rhodanese-related sulfurtransferase